MPQTLRQAHLFPPRANSFAAPATATMPNCGRNQVRALIQCRLARQTTQQTHPPADATPPQPICLCHCHPQSGDSRSSVPSEQPRLKGQRHCAKQHGATKLANWSFVRATHRFARAIKTEIRPCPQAAIGRHRQAKSNACHYQWRPASV